MNSSSRKLSMTLATLTTLLLVSWGTPPAGWADTYCPVGQEWPGLDPDWFEPGLITGSGQTFAVLVDPADGCDCPIGFTAVVADFFFSLPDSITFPFDMTYSLGLKDAVADPAYPCLLRPGTTICETPSMQVPIDVFKDFYGFGTALECPCVSMAHPVFVFLTIHSVLELPGALYTDGEAGPAACTFFSREGNGGVWTDMVAAGQLNRGNVVLWATANCCETPVAAEQTSWGTIKTRYR